MPSSTERLNLSITTSSGDLQAQVDVPTHFIPITDIVPVVRSLGEQAQALEVTKTLRTGLTISCQKGCGACCQRLMVPVSPPEAFALAKMLKDLPQDHRERIEHPANRNTSTITKRWLTAFATGIGRVSPPEIRFGC